MQVSITYRRRVLFYGILIVLIVIWGRVIIVLYEEVDEQLETSHSEKPVATDSFTVAWTWPARLPYVADFRDPFEPDTRLLTIPLNKSRAPVKKVIPPTGELSQVELPQVELPQIALQGITGITATLYGPNDQVYFVKSGDLIEGVNILSVEQDHVRARFKTNTFTLKLTP